MWRRKNLEINNKGFAESGSEPDPAFGEFNSGELDGWFLIDESTLSNDNAPLWVLTPMQVSSYQFSGGPSDISLFLGWLGRMDIRDVKVKGEVDDTKTSTPSSPPEAISEGLMVQKEIIGDGEGQGMCGNITVE